MINLFIAQIFKPSLAQEQIGDAIKSDTNEAEAKWFRHIKTVTQMLAKFVFISLYYDNVFCNVNCHDIPKLA